MSRRPAVGCKALRHRIKKGSYIRSEVEALRIKIEKAYEYARGRLGNEIIRGAD